MEHSIRVGFSFGLTSATITTLGLMVGLNSSTGSKLAVMGGIMTIAIADAFSDALGIHISEESENKHTSKEIWTATISTFLTKFLFALTFVVPVLLLELDMAIIVGVIWGLLALALMSYKMAKAQNSHYLMVVCEHLFIAFVVIVISHYVGHMVSYFF